MESTYNIPLFCPVCNNIMNKKLDKKIFMIHNKCFNCVIKEETKIRAKGKWEEYQSKVLEKNIESFLAKEKVNIENVINGLDKLEYIQNSSGDIEKWEMSKEELLKTKERYKNYLKEIEEHLNKIKSEEVIKNEA